MAQKEDGIYDLPSEPPLMTINLKLSHDNDFAKLHRSYASQMECLRRSLKKKFKTLVKGKGSKQKEFHLTPDGMCVFTVAFTDGKRTVTAIIEGRHMWVRGFQTTDGTIYEFLKNKEEESDESDKKKKKKQQDDERHEPRKYIKGSILLSHGGGYPRLLPGGPELENFEVGYPALKDMLNELSEFDPTRSSVKSLRAMAALIIHTAESIKNNFIHLIVLKSLDPVLGARMQQLTELGKAYINNWQKISRLILRYLHISTKVWDVNEQKKVKNEEFYKVPCWTKDPKDVLNHIIFIKGDEFPDTVLHVEDGKTRNLPDVLQASIGVVVVGGVNLALEYTTDIPCVAQVLLRATSLSSNVQLVEGEFPIYTSDHLNLCTLHLNLRKKEGHQKEVVKLTLTVSALLEATAHVSQVDDEAIYCQRTKTCKTNSEMSRNQLEVYSRNIELFEKLADKRATQSGEEYPMIDPMLLLSNKKETPLGLEGETGKHCLFYSDDISY
ncbi:hypothetical protein ACQ4PT_016501 [Festuca glaucescens]